MDKNWKTQKVFKDYLWLKQLEKIKLHLVLLWNSVLLYLRSPKSGRYSTSGDLSCTKIFLAIIDHLRNLDMNASKKTNERTAKKNINTI